MEHLEWLDKYGRIKSIADRIMASRLARYRALLHIAHVENSMMLHNAIASLHYGTPWKEVNYEAAKLAHYLETSGWLYYPSHIPYRWDARVRGYTAPEYTKRKEWKVDRAIAAILPTI